MTSDIRGFIVIVNILPAAAAATGRYSMMFYIESAASAANEVHNMPCSAAMHILIMTVMTHDRQIANSDL